VVYWTEHGSGDVTVAPQSGIIGLNEHWAGAHPAAIAVDGKTVFWTNDDVGDLGIVMKVVDFASSNPQPSPLVTGLSNPIALALDADTVYFATLGDGTIQSIPKAGGSATVLATGQGNPVDIAVDADRVYWTSIDQGRVMWLPKSGGVAVELAVQQAGPDGIAVDDSGVYWVCHDGGTVMWAPKP
jgi:hypothetical protein